MNFKTNSLDAERIIQGALSKGKEVTVTMGEDITIDISEPIKYTPHWIVGNPITDYKCSICGGTAYEGSKYCPHCGAMMIGEVECIK